MPVLGRKFLLQRGCRVFEEGVVFGMVQDQIGGRDLGAFKKHALPILSPGFTEELAYLITTGIEHRLSLLRC